MPILILHGMHKVLHDMRRCALLEHYNPSLSISVFVCRCQLLQSKQFTTMSEVDVKNFIIPNNQPVIFLDCNSAFENLNPKEKSYAHYLSRASFYGGLIVLVQVTCDQYIVLNKCKKLTGFAYVMQTSSESSSLFPVLHQIFHHQTVEELKGIAVNNCGLSEDEFQVPRLCSSSRCNPFFLNTMAFICCQAFLVYTAGVYANMGNYKGYGDSKIIPNLPAEKLSHFFQSTKAFNTNPKLTEQWNQIKNQVYDLSHRKCHLGLGDNGITTYFSANCTAEDGEIVKRYFKSIQMEGYNNRVFKTVVDGKTHYEVG